MSQFLMKKNSNTGRFESLMTPEQEYWLVHNQVQMYMNNGGPIPPDLLQLLRLYEDKLGLNKTTQVCESEKNGST